MGYKWCAVTNCMMPLIFGVALLLRSSTSAFCVGCMIAIVGDGMELHI